MKKINQIVEEYIFNRTIIKIIFIMVTMLISIPYIGAHADFFINLILFYGLLALGYELITGKLLDTLRSTKTTLILGGFTLSYIITILINKANYVTGFKSVGFMIIFFTVFFLFPKQTTKKNIIKDIKVISATIVLCTFILSFICFILYIFSISGEYTTNSGSYEAYYGLVDSRLWGLYNPNTSATFTIISIVLSLAFITIYKKKRIRIGLLFNVLIQFSVLLLTGSRAGLYTLAGASALLAFFAFIHKFKRFTFKTAFISTFAAGISLVLFFSISILLKNGLAYVPSITNFISAINNDVINESYSPNNSSEDLNDSVIQPNDQMPEINKIDLDRHDISVSQNNSFFENRIDIWRASFKEFLKQPILGVGRNNIVEKATENIGNEVWIYHFKHGNTHNIYLCVLVSSGIIGFLLMGSFVGIIVLKSIKTLSKTYKKINVWFLFSFVICLMFFANEFVESRILYKTSIFGVIFWIYCGYLYKLSKFERIESSAAIPEEIIISESEE